MARPIPDIIKRVLWGLAGAICYVHLYGKSFYNSETVRPLYESKLNKVTK